MGKSILELLMPFRSQNHREDILNRLLQDRLPVIIYGTGKFAKAVAEGVAALNVELFFCDVPRYYYPGKKMKIGEVLYGVLSEEEVHAFPKPFNLLSGMIDSASVQSFKGGVNCHQVAYLDLYASHIMNWAFVDKHVDALQELYETLADEKSREVMIAYIASRVTGEVSYISNCFLATGYSYSYDILNLQKKDVVVDGGAYCGDTILEMQAYLLGNMQKVYAFEPDDKNYGELQRRFRGNDSIVCLQAGLHDYDGTMGLSNDGTMGSSLTETSAYKIPVLALDGNEMFHDVSVIKMDIEGNELAALHGMRNLIQKNKPNLAICIYHKNEDIVNIWQFFRELKLSYRYYLRQHSRSVEETVFYAVHE